MAAELIIKLKETTLNPVICEGDFYESPSGKQYYTEGFYKDTVINSMGCDSILNINLTVNQHTYGTDVITACGEYTWIDGITYTESNNTATYVLSNAAGCDSIVTLDLSIINLDLTTTVEGATIAATETDAEYQWLNCDDNYSIIEGETSQTFTATTNGSYAVMITKDGCTDTSDCVAIIATGISEVFKKDQIDLYPNPTRGEVNIDFDKPLGDFHINIRNTAGKLVLTEKFHNTQEVDLHIEGAPGLYFVEILHESERVIFKVLKINRR